MSDSLTASTVTLTGADGDEIEAYLARPADHDRRGGVVLIHHLPGYDRVMKEFVRRFAEIGYDAVMPNLYSRQGPGLSPDEARAAAMASGWVSNAQLISDVQRSADYLRSLDTSNGKVGVIGYCSGGRQSVLAACNVDLDAAVDCYGGWVTGQRPAEFPVQYESFIDQLPGIRCPLLGLFGNDDSAPSPAHVDELEQILKDAGKPYEFHRYDGAGHAFWYYHTPAYRPEAAMDAWQRVFTFFGERLGSPPT